MLQPCRLTHSTTPQGISLSEDWKFIMDRRAHDFMGPDHYSLEKLDIYTLFKSHSLHLKLVIICLFPHFVQNWKHYISQFPLSRKLLSNRGNNYTLYYFHKNKYVFLHFNYLQSKWALQYISTYFSLKNCY